MCFFARAGCFSDAVVMLQKILNPSGLQTKYHIANLLSIVHSTMNDVIHWMTYGAQISKVHLHVHGY